MSKPIYVESEDAQAEIEAFIAKFQLNASLTRRLRRYAEGVVTVAPPPPEEG
jgi:hypothetical protein